MLKTGFKTTYADLTTRRESWICAWRQK